VILAASILTLLVVAGVVVVVMSGPSSRSLANGGGGGFGGFGSTHRHGSKIHKNARRGLNDEEEQQPQHKRQPKDGGGRRHHHSPIEVGSVDAGSVYDVAVAGAGPAGLTAALFAARAGLSVIVLGSSAGTLSQAKRLDNFPSYHRGGDNGIGDESEEATGGPGWLESTKAQASSFGATFAPPGLLASSLRRFELAETEALQREKNDDGSAAATTTSISSSSSSYFALKTPSSDEEFATIRAWSVIVATGATPKRLGLPHEDKLWGSSIHSCPICDGHLYDDSSGAVGGRPRRRGSATTTVLVVGGGDAAMDAALLLARYATHVVIVHRRDDDFSSAKDRGNVELVRAAPNVRILTPYTVQGWIVDDDDDPTKLTGVRLLLGNSGGDARRRGNEHKSNNSGPSSLSSEDSRVLTLEDIDGAFVMIGAAPNTGWLAAAPAPAEPRSRPALNNGHRDDDDDDDDDDGDVKLDMDDEGLIRLVGARGTTGTTTTVDGGNHPAAAVAATATSIGGIFASGEVTDAVYKQAITAAASGAQAAIDAERWLRRERPGGVAARRQRARRPHVAVHINGKDNDKNNGEVEVAPQQEQQQQQQRREEQQQPLPRHEQEEEEGGEEEEEEEEESAPAPEEGTGDDAGSVDCDLSSQDCLTSIVKAHPVVVFFKPWCPYCRRALETLALAGAAQPLTIDLSHYSNMEDIQDALRRMTGRRTVPNVFVGGSSIGGGDETTALQRRGELVTLLREAGGLSAVGDHPRVGRGLLQRSEQAKPGHGSDEPVDGGAGGGDDFLQSEKYFKDVLKQYPVVMFSLPWCPQCKQLKEFLKRLGVEYHLVDLNDPNPVIQSIRYYVNQNPGLDQVPNLFVGGELIGGITPVTQLHESGQLIPMLERVGVSEASKRGGESCDLQMEDCFMEVLKKYPAVMFSLSWCPECKRSLELLSQLGVQPHIIDLDDYKPISEDIRAHMLKMTNRRQVPNLFVGGEYVGGFHRTTDLHSRGELVPMLERAGILEAKGSGESCDLQQEECFKEVLHRYPVVIFTLRYCRECKESLEFLSRLGVQPHIIDLDDHKPIKDYIMEHMRKMTDRWQVPNLFVGGEYIGGFQRMEGMHGNGELVPKLQKVGVL
jgi:glutaredoxin